MDNQAKIDMDKQIWLRKCSIDHFLWAKTANFASMPLYLAYQSTKEMGIARPFTNKNIDPKSGLDREVSNICGTSIIMLNHTEDNNPYVW